MTIPKTLEEAVAVLKAEAEQEAADWASMPIEQALAAVHHWGGRRIRNDWGLWTGSELARHLHSRFGLTHADDMSGLILHCLHREMNGRPWDVETEIERNKAWWAAQGGMPKPPWEKADAADGAPTITEVPEDDQGTVWRV